MNFLTTKSFDYTYIISTFAPTFRRYIMAWHDAITKEEEEFIKAHVSDMTIGDIALALGRSYFTIQKHTDMIGHHPIHKWTQKEDDVLISLYGNYMVEYIARVLGIDANCVYNRIRRLKKKGVLK